MGAFVLGELPALPLHEAGKYVAGAYVVLFVLVLVYVAIMAIRLGRVERELGELLELSQRPGVEQPGGEQLGVERPDLERPGVEHSGIESTPAPEALDVGRPRSTPVGAPSE